jgi:hypothetical protein
MTLFTAMLDARRQAGLKRKARFKKWGYMANDAIVTGGASDRVAKL